MEASLTTYIPGTIVRYDAPFNKKICAQYAIPSSHPVLILNTPTLPSPNFQAMIISSKVDNYYGYRLFLNTTDTTYKKMSVICSNQIYTINRRYLHDILGFISRELLEKVLKAYAYEIGLSMELPEYYANDETCISWIGAGQPNIPDKPNPFDLKVGGVEAGRNMPIAVHTRPFNDTQAGIVSVVARTPHVSAEPVDPREIETELPVEGNAGADFDFDKEIKGTEKEVPGTNPPKAAPEEDGNAPEQQESATARKQRVTHKFPKMCQELYERIEAHEIPKYTPVANLQKFIDRLSVQQKYDIFMRKINGYDLMSKGVVPTRRNGEHLIGATVKRIEDDKAYIISGALNGTINWRILADRYVPALRCMTVKEIHDVRMGQETYFEIVQTYEIPRNATYIGECEAAGIYTDYLSGKALENPAS